MAATVYNEKQLPLYDLPEVALVGRSNVGKSSLINCLANRKNLAKTSATPGKTRSINFYLVDNSWYLVDLPGYGYARASLQAQKAWARLIEAYLKERRQLRGLVHLIDIRHPPMASDLEMQEWLKFHGIPSRVVATKLDKIPRGKRAQHLAVIRKNLALTEEAVPFSAVSGEGTDEVLSLIADWIRG